MPSIGECQRGKRRATTQLIMMAGSLQGPGREEGSTSVHLETNLKHLGRSFQALRHAQGERTPVRGDLPQKDTELPFETVS